jgi:hypothetical protein
VEADCQPANADPVKYFDWATLHEVAHAVDAKHKFMDKNGSQAKYGGWKEHGSDVGPIAQAVADHFGASLNNDDKAALKGYAAALMRKQKPKAKRSPEEDAKRPDVKTWYDAVNISKNLWWDGASSTSIAGTVYQEGYKGWWVSYKLDARKQGIHGYQFRAPGEWFAELYAAYYSKKLKASHPFIPDLKALEK